MKQKILFIVNHEIVIYNFRKELVRKLLDENYDVYICSPPGKKINYLVEQGCKFIEMNVDRHGTNPLADLLLIYKYVKIINEVKPLAVLTYTIKPNIYGAIACRITKTHCLANITGLGSAVENPGIMQKITMTLYHIGFKHIDMVYFQNQENLDFFKIHFKKMPQYQLLPGSGVNLQEFTPLEYPDDSVIRFVFISRIMKEKGIDQYLEAAKAIKEKYQNTEFHICGFCEEEYEEVLQEYEKQGIIKYHGLIDDVREILKITHCTIHPTYYPEGMSNVLLESCACARPIITTDRSGCREIVDDGINGFVVKQKDDKDLIKKTIMFIDLMYDKKKEFALNARKKIAVSFDRNIIINEYLKIIKKF